MIAKLNDGPENLPGFKLSGRLHDVDHRHFALIVEEAVKAHGKVRLPAHLDNFDGADVHAIRADTNFANRHSTDMEHTIPRGEERGKRWTTGICKPLTPARLRCFDVKDLESAGQCLSEPA